MRFITSFLLIIIIVSCKTTITSLDYGVLDRRNVCSNEYYKNGNLTLKIKDYEFIFLFDEFEKELISYEEEPYSNKYSETLKKYLNQDRNLKFERIDGVYFVNEKNRVEFIENFGIEASFDNLFKTGKFYLKSKKNIQCMEHEHWEPREQGTINSKWIIDGKITNKIIFGFTD